MRNFLDDWEERVRNTRPLTLTAWTIDTFLEFPTVPGIDEFEVMFAVEERLAEANRLFGRQSTFVINQSHAPEFYSLSNNGTSYVWPSRWELIARDADQALERLNDYVGFVSKISEALKWMPKVYSVLPNDTDQLSSRTVTFTPVELVTNHPHYNLWTKSETEPSDSSLEFRNSQIRLDAQRLELRTSTVQEAKRSLDSLAVLLPLVKDDSYNWKWVIIAAHNTLQNFIVAALEGTNPGRVLHQPDRADSGSGATTWIKPRLLSFPELYDRVKRFEFMSQNIDSRPYKPERNEGPSIKRLNDLRNEFTHFDPKALVMSVEETLTLPRMMADVLDAIEFLAFESHNVRWHVYPIERVETRLQLNHVRGLIKDLVNHYWTENKRLEIGISINQIRPKALFSK